MRQTPGAMDPITMVSSGLLPSLLVVSHERWGEADNVRTAALFLDVQSAYYRILRQAAYGLDLDGDLDRHVLRVLNAFGLRQEDWREIIDLVQGGGTIADAGGSQHLQGLIADTHRESFFVSRHSDGSRLVRTLAGSRPGESLADTIFAHVYGRVLRKIRGTPLEFLLVRRGLEPALSGLALSILRSDCWTPPGLMTVPSSFATLILTHCLASYRS